MLLPLPLLAGAHTAGSVMLGADTAAVDGDVSVIAHRCAFVLVIKSIGTWVVCKIAVTEVTVGAVGTKAVLVPAVCDVAVVGGMLLLHMVSSLTLLSLLCWSLSRTEL
jgi:hypothetical protein